MPKAERLQPQQRRVRHHHRLALRQQADEAQYGVDSMPETAENVADDFKIEREAQDRMALASQQRPPPPSLPATWPGNRARDHPAEEGRRHRREPGRAPARHHLEALAKLKGVVRPTAR
jgi:acetyl-CoA C-acetyltransferase